MRFKRRALVYIRRDTQIVLRPNPSMSVAYSPTRNEGGISGAVADMATKLMDQSSLKPAGP